MSYLTQEDERNFGHEIIDLIQRGSRQTMAPILDRLEERDEQLREGLQRAAKTAIDHALDTAVPNWRQVNSNPRWIEWLNFPEPLSGCRRQELLNDAVARGDADRTTRPARPARPVGHAELSASAVKWPPDFQRSDPSDGQPAPEGANQRR